MKNQKFNINQNPPEIELFKTPDSYFEEFPQKVQHKLSSSSDRKIGWFIPVAAVSGAFSLFILVAILGIFFTPHHKLSERKSIAYNEDFTEFLLDDQDYALTEEELIDLLAAIEADQTIIFQFIDDDFSTEDILEQDQDIYL